MVRDRISDSFYPRIEMTSEQTGDAYFTLDRSDASMGAVVFSASVIAKLVEFQWAIRLVLSGQTRDAYFTTPLRDIARENSIPR